MRVLLINQDSEWNRERCAAEFGKASYNILHSWLMAHEWTAIWLAGPGLSGIAAPLSVDLIEIFRLSIVRFELVVADGPCGRNAAVMAQLAKIFFAKTEKRCAIEFCVSTNVVVRA